jgi:hypothetical protein
LHVAKESAVVTHANSVQVRAQVSSERLLFAGCNRELAGVLLVRKQFDALLFENRLLRRQ